MFQRMLILLFLSTLLYHSTSGMTPTRSDTAMTDVTVGIVLLDVYQIDNLEETISAEFILSVKWKDQSLIGPAQQGTRSIPFDDVQAPPVQIRNIFDVSTLRDRNVDVDTDGTVHFLHRYTASVKQKFDFRNFPFDVQTWNLVIFNSANRKINIIPDAEFQGMNVTNSLSIPDWSVSYEGQEVAMIKNFDQPIQTIQVKYRLKRKATFYIWKVVVPLMLVTFMSWSVFWINPRNISAQLTVSVTAILTLIAFQFTVAQLLPALPYLTALDTFTIGTDILVFLAFLETIITSYQEDHGRVNKSQKIDRISQVLFPVTYSILLLVTLIL